jgi:hypothetical protein
MSEAIKKAADTVLKYTTERLGGVPGVVAMATDRKANIYEGAAGRRELGKDQPMTTDTVFAIFSTTKPLTGTLVMQLVEEGRIRLDEPAKRYVPEISELEVLEGFDGAGKPKTRAPKRHHDQRSHAAHVGPVLRVLQRRRLEIPHHAQHSDDRFVPVRCDPHRAAARSR